MKSSLGLLGCRLLVLLIGEVYSQVSSIIYQKIPKIQTLAIASNGKTRKPERGVFGVVLFPFSLSPSAWQMIDSVSRNAAGSQPWLNGPAGWAKLLTER